MLLRVKLFKVFFFKDVALNTNGKENLVSSMQEKKNGHFARLTRIKIRPIYSSLLLIGN